MCETYQEFRIVPIDRPHADYLPPAYNGHSVGRWDADALGVDARSLRRSPDGASAWEIGEYYCEENDQDYDELFDTP